MSDSFDEAVKKLKGPDFEDRGQMFPHFDAKAAAEYLREKFIPRARVEALHKQFEDAWKVHHSHATMPADNIRELFEYLLEK